MRFLRRTKVPESAYRRRTSEARLGEYVVHAPTDRERALGYLDFAEGFLNLGIYDHALMLAESGRERLLAHGDDGDMAVANFLVAGALCGGARGSDPSDVIHKRTTADLDDALALFRLAISGFRSVGDVTGEARVLLNLAATYSDPTIWASDSDPSTADIDEALDYAARAVALYDELGEPRAALLAVERQVQLTSIHGRSTEHVEFLRCIASRELALGDRFRCADVWHSMAVAMFNSGRIDDAHRWLETALAAMWASAREDDMPRVAEVAEKLTKLRYQTGVGDPFGPLRWARRYWAEVGAIEQVIACEIDANQLCAKFGTEVAAERHSEAVRALDEGYHVTDDHWLTAPWPSAPRWPDAHDAGSLG